MLSTSALQSHAQGPLPAKVCRGGVSFSPEQESQAGYQKSNSSVQKYEGEFQEEGRLAHWSIQQQNTLLALHNQRGNKWVAIALRLNKSDNQVKNRYYSKLRKGIRRMNKMIDDGALPGKQIKGNFISKVIQTAEDVYLKEQAPLRKAHPQANEAYCTLCHYSEIKNAVLDIAALPQEGLTPRDSAFMRETVLRIIYFNKNYRKQFKDLSARPVVSCKYKGKEIKILLKENQQTVLRNQLREEVRQGDEVSIEQLLPQSNHQILIPVASPVGHLQQAYFIFGQPCFPSFYLPPCFPSFYLPCLPTYDAFSSVTTFGSETRGFGSGGAFSAQ